MKRYIKDNLSTIVIFGLLAGWLLYQRIPMYQASTQMESKPAPDFVLRSAENQPVQLSSFRGQVVVVNFWATWCLPCRVEIPILKSLHAELQNHGLVILGITQESPAQVLPFLEKHQIEYSILFDADARVADDYGIRGYPTIVVVDKDGQIKSFTTGLNLLMKWQIRRLVTGSWL